MRARSGLLHRGVPFSFSKRSLEALAGVDKHLNIVMHRAIEITPVDFGITEGRRTLDRQRRLLAAGATETMDSKHLTGRAVDVAAYIDGKVRWDWPLYEKIAKAVKQAAFELEIQITWGGDWRTLRDGPHFELHD